MIPVLEVGGTHVSAALVDPEAWTVDETPAASTRLHLDGDADADSLLGSFVAAAQAVEAPAGVTWGVAMPDPFDYDHGIGRFEGVGKFGSLHGVGVGAALRERLGIRAAFVNDADAFTIGEWVAGSAHGAERVAGITLGTGVGSGWLIDGLPVDPGIPPGGRIHQLDVDGAPLEDVMSRRAIRRVYAARGGDADADVKQIAGAARAGEPLAAEVLDAAMTALGAVVARCLVGFPVDVLVIGGSMSASWDLFDAAFRAGAGGGLPEIVAAAHPDTSPLLGAALHAQRHLVG